MSFNFIEPELRIIKYNLFAYKLIQEMLGGVIRDKIYF